MTFLFQNRTETEETAGKKDGQQIFVASEHTAGVL